MALINQLQLDHAELLLEGSIKGDRASQYRLYNLLAPKMMGVCMRYAHSRNEAADLLQEGFIKVFEKLPQFRREGSFEGWVRRIMVNTAMQRFRGHTQEKTRFLTDFTIEQTPSPEDLLGILNTKDLLGMVQQLPPACRLVFNLFVFEGMKHREIAEALGISEGTSKSNLSDARLLLQKAIQKTTGELNTKKAC